MSPGSGHDVGLTRGSLNMVKRGYYLVGRVSVAKSNYQGGLAQGLPPPSAFVANALSAISAHPYWLSFPQFVLSFDMSNAYFCQIDVYFYNC